MAKPLHYPIKSGIEICSGSPSSLAFPLSCSRVPSLEVARDWIVCRPDGQTVMPMDELPLIRALRGETVQDAELMQVNKEGRKLPLLCNAAPICDATGAIVGGIVAWRDITDRKRAEEALREREERLSASLAEPGDGEAKGGRCWAGAPGCVRRRGGASGGVRLAQRALPGPSSGADACQTAERRCGAGKR
jgi:hypothetical protein